MTQNFSQIKGHQTKDPESQKTSSRINVKKLELGISYFNGRKSKINMKIDFEGSQRNTLPVEEQT